ncbi:unnamed protein product [Arabis nemorensis]|uniref:Uncharacterized protein n=1 Tax=Arabis nemorensis TaxID=586526 RepID=A0A565AWF0_9BRAS|nr:unnamed protein product [Arabis nemorensis]
MDLLGVDGSSLSVAFSRPDLLAMVVSGSVEADCSTSPVHHVLRVGGGRSCGSDFDWKVVCSHILRSALDSACFGVGSVGTVCLGSFAPYVDNRGRHVQLSVFHLSRDLYGHQSSARRWGSGGKSLAGICLEKLCFLWTSHVVSGQTS